MSDAEQNRNPPDSTQAPQLAENIEEAAQQEIATAQPDPAVVAAETTSLELDQLKLKVQRLENDLKEAKDLHSLRKEYTDKLFGLILWWLIIVVVFVLLSATARPAFNLSDTVLVAFITSTTVSVLGLFVLVAKWLFPSLHKDGESNKKE